VSPLGLKVGWEVRPRTARVSARFPSPTFHGRGVWTQKLINWLGPLCSSGALAMPQEPTTAVIQRYLDALPGDTVADPLMRELLERAVGRLRLLCSTFLYKSHPRLARPPVNREADELLGGVVAGLLPEVLPGVRVSGALLEWPQPAPAATTNTAMVTATNQRRQGIMAAPQMKPIRSSANNSAAARTARSCQVCRSANRRRTSRSNSAPTRLPSSTRWLEIAAW
jgi:hypothetical protein